MITRLRLTDMRAFPDGAELTGCTRINLLLGPNSSGKTSILEALYTLESGTSLLGFVDFLEYETRLFDDRKQRSLGVSLQDQAGRDIDYVEEMQFPERLRFSRSSGGSGESIDPVILDSAVAPLPPDVLIDRKQERHSIQVVKDCLRNRIESWYSKTIPRIYYFPGHRSLRLDADADEAGSLLTRAGLSKRLRVVQESYDIGIIKLISKQLARYLSLFDDHELGVIRDQHGHERFVVANREGKRTSLLDCGDGIAQLVMLVAAMAFEEERRGQERGDSWPQRCNVLLMDEPEAHLHPSLWRGFLGRLGQEASAGTLQLFIATHSPEVAAYFPDATVFETSQKDSSKIGGCRLRRLSDEFVKLGIQADVFGHRHKAALISHLALGGRCIIVEGVADQIVFQHLCRENGSHDVLVVPADGQSGVVAMTKRISKMYTSRIAAVGIIDSPDTRRVADKALPIHVMKQSAIENYYKQVMPSRRRTGSGKVEAAVRVVTQQDGYDFADRTEIDRELSEALDLFGPHRP